MEHCEICGSALMSATVCRRHGGCICMNHCRGCEYFDALTFHCLYYLMVEKPKLDKAAAEQRSRELIERRRELYARWAKKK